MLMKMLLAPDELKKFMSNDLIVETRTNSSKLVGLVNH